LKPLACIFPLPRTIDNVFTKQGYEITYLLAIKIFHKTSSDALIQAEKMAESIRKNKRAIPILNEDGTVTENSIKFTKIDCSVADDNVAIINLQWDQYYPFN
jgi:hypothetical protein